MNWKFWQKKNPAPTPVTSPVVKPMMSPLEEAIMDHFLKNEKDWTIRRWKSDDFPAIRADFQNTTVVSVGRVPPNHLRFDAYVGYLKFSPDFATLWHLKAEYRLRAKENAEVEKSANATRIQLEQRFGVTVK